jgi:hypothetical protein
VPAVKTKTQHAKITINKFLISSPFILIHHYDST